MLLLLKYQILIPYYLMYTLDYMQKIKCEVQSMVPAVMRETHYWRE